MVIESNSIPANPINDFEEFFKEFEETPNVFKYRQKISEAYSKSENYITVLFEDILNFKPILANYLKNHPEQALRDAVDAFKNLIRIDAGGLFNANEEYRVRISSTNNSNEVHLRKIRATHIDKLIYVKGIIIRASDVRPQITQAVFECPLCGNIMQEEQTTRKLSPPRQCSNPNCKNNRNFRVITDESEFIDYQLITIQESPEELRPGDIPKTLQAILYRDLVDSVRPGERVKIMGILKSIPKEDRRGRLSTVFIIQLIANSIEGLTQEDEEIELTQDDIDQIRALSQEPLIQKKIARSIARTILGQEQLKMAAALSLFGGIQKVKKDGSKLRGDIHVLFLGDPGTGKSQILQSCALISRRSVYTSGKGASAAGLTAAVLRENDNSGMQLEAGALVLASGGTACIDEFDKMRKTDRVAIHEAMEQQTISIAKGGIVATLQAKTAIIAAANPKQGRWNDYETAIENINLSPPILSRFDLIFVIRDKPEKHADEKIAEYILNSHMQGYEETFSDDEEDSGKGVSKALDFIPMELLKKYIRYCKNNSFPRLTKKTAEKIRSFYVEMRNMNPEGSTAVSIVARTLDGIVRMCEAYAKMALRDVVKEEDVDAIIELVKRYMKDIGYDEETKTFDVDIMMTGRSHSKQEKFNKILSKIKELTLADPSTPLEFDDIFEPISNIKGITKEFVQQALKEWVNEGTLYCPKNGQYRLTKKPK
ncbi:MAG: minichromosome maintenance protein MCM [Promethearchaeota archaeon]